MQQKDRVLRAPGGHLHARLDASLPDLQSSARAQDTTALPKANNRSAVTTVALTHSGITGY